MIKGKKMDEILRFERVWYRYEEGRMALTDFSVTIRAGERIAVLGENGAGKSTFFLLANGVLRPEKGTVLWNGIPIGRDVKSLNALRKGVGLVFQDPDVQILAGTVAEEISFGPVNLGLSLAQVSRRVEAALDTFALQPYRDRAPQSLSGGEKKRVTLADAAAMDPQLLLLDEPASSLDPVHARQLEEYLALLSRRGLALMVATHDVDFAWRWADRVLVFHNGTLAADGGPAQIFEQEELLRRCGLEQPVLIRIARILGLKRAPRTVEELEQEWRV